MIEVLGAWGIWLLEALAKSILVGWLIRLFWEPPFLCRQHYVQGWNHGYFAGIATFVVLLIACRLMDHWKKDRG